MDERTLRAHFERAARAALPPSTVDVARARQAGRRRLRIRRAGIPAASSFGVAVVVGALFAAGVLPPGAASSPAPTNHVRKTPGPKRVHGGHARGPMAPASFDPLAIYASFGWLPPGFTVANSDSPQTTTLSVASVTGPGDQTIALKVYAANQCSVTGPLWWPPKGSFHFAGTGSHLHKVYLHSRRYAHGLRCGQGQSFSDAIRPAGHLPDGHPAYVILNVQNRPYALAWSYARDGWATAQWTGLKLAQLKKVAARVRYRSNVHLRFPFRLTDVPAGWTVTGAGSQVQGGQQLGYLLYVNPGDGSDGITILIEQPYPGGCVNIGGTTQPATFDGASGVTRTAGQEACFGDLDGLYVYVKAARAGGGLSLLHHLKLFGPNPANWTTRPLG